ncbi:D-sedoheptulose 7-phosphate isomerase [Candidatus Providencia siddallii]|uniref:D-sedoheptulose-7-phosphate isomerase n=1 Tax=Candidatus Providencia siddallii TaxID=1715285 RepID=A0ABM9NPQ9_9GAMM
MYQNLIKNELIEATNILVNFTKNKKNIELIQSASLLIANALKKRKKILSCGNGGSHCDAMHFAEELTGKYRKKRKAYPAIAISDASYLSCVSNDFGYQYVFSRFIEAIGSNDDVLLVISSSGKSKNIINAIRTAHKKNMKIILLTGKNNNKIPDFIDIKINVQHLGYADRIQEIHIKIIHILIYLIEKEMTK